MTELSPEQVARIDSEVSEFLQSEKMRRSPALAELLKYLRDRARTQHSDPTTEYAIAQDVLGKDAEFDPKLDTSVRVRIRRLRQALDEFYAGRDSGMRLVIPPTSYDLSLASMGTELPERHPVRSILWLILIGTLALFGYFFMSQGKSENAYPVVRILPIQNLTGRADVDIFETGLQRQLASDLQRFGRLRVVMSVPEKADPVQADFTLRGSILAMDEHIDISYRLERVSDNEEILASRIKGNLLGQDYYGAISRISSQISGHVAGQGGATSLIRKGVEMRVAGFASDNGVARDVFECIVLSDLFFENYDVSAFVKSYRCFQSVMDDVPLDGVAFARWGTMVFHTVSEFDLMQTEQLPADMRATPNMALDLAERIVGAYPQSSDAFLLLGSVQNAMGEVAAAELSLRRAMELNPGDPTTRAVLAYLFLKTENFEEAISSAEEAIRLSSDPQGYIYLPIALSALVLDRPEQVISAGTAYASKRSGDGAMVIKLVVARVQKDQAVIDHLSPVVAGLDNPLSGFSNFIRGERMRAALHDILPEIEIP